MALPLSLGDIDRECERDAPDDEKLIRLLRAYHQLEQLDLLAQGCPPRAAVAARRRPVPPTTWVGGPWQLRPTGPLRVVRIERSPCSARVTPAERLGCNSPQVGQDRTDPRSPLESGSCDFSSRRAKIPANQVAQPTSWTVQ